jgi:hypothetical protein
MIDAITATQEDLVKGLSDAFRIDPSDIKVDSPVNEPVLANDAYAAVLWALRGTHTGTFVGLEPTGREVTIEGLTLVKLPEREGDDPQFMRFVDWSEVLGQLGVSMSGRPILAE